MLYLISPSVSLQVVFLLCLMIMLSHWLACIWFIMYKYSTFTNSASEWAFDILGDGNKISYYLGAYYQCFLLIVGNNQVGGPLLDAFFIMGDVLPAHRAGKRL